ncbi:magnesium/cobalt transporter CorA [Robiginitalea sp. IMCC43444]|uniref:magnesium/cobalt transporter CorA n=1 Tax=Robiginitalea sp. IMCC43444 TaxID=3459121 RepID=UPI0040410412
MSKKKASRIRIRAPKISKRGRKLGKAPGTVTYMGNREGGTSSIQQIVYNDEFLEKKNITADDVHKGPAEGLTEWINITGLSEEAIMSRLGDQIGLNALVVEDIVNTEQRPKVDEYEDHIFAVFKMLYLNGDRKIVKEHVALVLKKGQVFLYQEIEADVFGGVRERIEGKSGRIRSRGADYLFFALIDALIDNYFLVLDAMEEQIDELENEVYTTPTAQTAAKIQTIRKEVITLRGWMAPVKELVNRLIESDSELIGKDTRVFLRDALDHSIEINENLQIHREMAFSLMDMYMSNVSNRMNEVMKVLTIMASIFIPLTFVAGIYGMNFKNMPELETENGYFVVLGVMLALFIGMIIYFKNKRWL